MANKTKTKQDNYCPILPHWQLLLANADIYLWPMFATVVGSGYPNDYSTLVSCPARVSSTSLKKLTFHMYVT